MTTNPDKIYSATLEVNELLQEVMNVECDGKLFSLLNEGFVIPWIAILGSDIILADILQAEVWLEFTSFSGAR